MIEPRWPLGVGGRLLIDGEAVTITSVDGANVRASRRMAIRSGSC
jgi:hypothetical protein